MPIETCWIGDPCDACGGEENPVIILTTIGTSVVNSMVLCARCRIELEATLRGLRKRGPRIPKGQ